jgi:hypothetical protein
MVFQDRKSLDRFVRQVKDSLHFIEECFLCLRCTTKYGRPFSEQVGKRNEPRECKRILLSLADTKRDFTSFLLVRKV